jgi:hypothetical protein
VPVADELAASRVQQQFLGERASDTPLEIFLGESPYRHAHS